MNLAAVRLWACDAAGPRRFLLGLPVAVFFSTSFVQPAFSAKNKNTFVYAIVGDISTLDPHWQYDGVSSFAAEQVYEGLIGYEGAHTDRFEPRIAVKVPSKANGLISKDGRDYTFPIRKGVLFHDGTPLTPEDVRYSLLRSILQDRDAGHAWMLLDAILAEQTTRDKAGRPMNAIFARAQNAIQVKGDSIRITLERPFAPFLSILPAYGHIVSKKWAVAHGAWDGTRASWTKFNNPAKESTAFFKEANGTGPFKVERWDRRGKNLILERNESYWRTPAKLKRVIIKTVDEFSTRKLLLQGGDADAVFMDRNYLPQFARMRGVTIKDDLPFMEVHNTFLFGFDVNTKGNPYAGSGRLDGQGIPPGFFKDKTIRLAFAHAFPYETYIRDVYRGKGARSRGPIPKGVLGYNPKQALYPHDLRKAEEFFKKARGGEYWEKGFRFTCVYQQGKETRGQACRILKSVVERLNPKFRIDVRGLQWSTYLDLHRKRKLPLVNARWGLDYPDPHNPVFAYLHSEGTYGKAQGYKNPRMDRLIERAASETDPARRISLYAKIQRLAYEDLPQIYTIDTVDFRVTRSWVKDFEYNPMMMYGYLYPVYKK